jgi:tetratricopeptide (TPR) repeat protein
LLSVKKFPQDARCWYNFGVTMHRLKQPQQAVSCYNHAIKYNPRHTLALVNRGILCATLGNREQAKQDWRAALAIDPCDDWSPLVGYMLRFADAANFQEVLDKVDTTATSKHALS